MPVLAHDEDQVLLIAYLLLKGLKYPEVANEMGISQEFVKRVKYSRGKFIQHVLKKHGIEAPIYAEECFEDILIDNLRSEIMENPSFYEDQDNEIIIEVITPDGEILLINNIRRFCNEEGIPSSNFCAMLNGRLTTTAGFKARYLKQNAK